MIAIFVGVSGIFRILIGVYIIFLFSHCQADCKFPDLTGADAHISILNLKMAKSGLQKQTKMKDQFALLHMWFNVHLFVYPLLDSFLC